MSVPFIDVDRLALRKSILFFVPIYLIRDSRISVCMCMDIISLLTSCWCVVVFFFVCIFCFPQAKQRASVQWLLSKSYSHQVPEDVREPFYRDAEVKDLIIKKKTFLSIFFPLKNKESWVWFQSDHLVLSFVLLFCSFCRWRWIGSRVSETVGGSRPSQRRTVLPGIGAHLRRSELQPVEPLGRHPGPGQKGRLLERAIRCGVDGDDSNSHITTAHGIYLMSFTFLVSSSFFSPQPITSIDRIPWFIFSVIS